MANDTQVDQLAGRAERLQQFYAQQARSLEHTMMTERFKAAMQPRYDAAKFAASVDAVLGRLREVLISKNAKYGDSALNPVRIFSTVSTVEQLRVAIDHKLSRLARGSQAEEDTKLDLMGYLVLLQIAESEQESP